MKRKLILTLLLLPMITVLFAFEKESYSNLRFKNYSTHEGLSQSSVLSITQDAEGFIWMGTKDGLNRFDGYRFITYKNAPDDSASLSNNEVIFLSTSVTGNLFIGTRGGGLNYYIKNENRFIRMNQLNLMDGTVSHVEQRDDNSILVCTSQGLFKGVPVPNNSNQYNFTNLSKNSAYLDAKGALLPYDRSAISMVTLQSISKHSYLAGSFKGLFIFNEKDLSFTQVDLGILNVAKINSLEYDLKGRIWVGTSEGMAILNIEGEIVSKVEILNDAPEWSIPGTSWIEKVLCDHDGNIWAATRGAGVVLIDPSGNLSDHFADQSFASQVGDNIINSMLIDTNGILWLGTESRGAVTLDLFRKKFNHLEINSVSGQSLTTNMVTAITGKNNTVWVGTAFNGLDYLHFNSDNTISTRHFNQIPYGDGMASNEIISLLLDKDETLWIGTASNNLVSYRPERGFQTLYTGGFAFALHQDQEGAIWLGTWGQGLGLLDQNKSTISFYSNQPDDTRTLSGDIILSIYDDQLENLWVGTKGRGLNVVPLGMIKNGYNNFVSYDKNNGLLHNDVYCIYEDADGIMWIGTGGGLNRLDLQSDSTQWSELYKGRARFEAFTEKEGLPANLIYGLLEDLEGNLWISTTKGLSKFNKKNRTFKNYNTNDGLQSNEFHSNAFYANQNKKMFFGGVNGLTFFDPSEITGNQNPSKVVISSLKVANMEVFPHQEVNGKIILDQDISRADKITLSHRHKDFSIEFSDLHFNHLDGVSYAYRLLGYNDEWRYLENSEHIASYTNLWEGDYIFQVKSTNNEGIWNETPTELEIEMLPPFWRSNWFYAFYVLIVIVGLLLFRRYTLIGVADKNRLLIEHIERTNLIENTEAKMRFFTNISHEIRTPLTLISNPLEEVIRNGVIDEKSRTSLQLVSRNVNRLLHLTNQLLQLRKIDKGGVEPVYSQVNAVAFLKEIISYFLQKALNKEITLSFNCEIDPDETMWIDSEMITTAIYNLISNAYKFTPSKGSISITLSKQGEALKKIERLKRKKVTSSKQWFCIEVSDTGPGIAPSEIQNIYHRFYQSKSASNKEQSGSGIGLSIVKEYIDLHQGRIEARSKLGEGATFSLFIPAGHNHIKDKKLAENPVQPLSRILSMEKEPEQNNQPVLIAENQQDLPKLLLVEDDKDLCSYLAGSLSDRFNVITAYDGMKGIEKAFELLPQIIISDLMMPNIDGLELCETLKNNERTKHIPIILLTAKAADENKIEGYQRGADLYVSKPFQLEVLRSQIDQLLNNRKLLTEIFSKQIFLKPRDIEISSADEKFLTRINQLLDDHLSESDFDVSSMVEKMNLSHSTVLKKVKNLTGMSLVEFVKMHRLKRAAQILEKKHFQIAEVAYMVGFSDPKYFSKCFSKAYGKTPSEYVQEHRGE